MLRPILLISALALGIALGYYPGKFRAKPTWWKFFALAVVLIAAIITLATPLAGNFGDVEWTRNSSVDKIPVILSLDSDEYKVSDEGSYLITAHNPANLFESKSISKEVSVSPADYVELKKHKSVIANMMVDPESNRYSIIEIGSTDPVLYFPANPALAQKIKNLNFHVPMSWVATIAFLIGAIYGFRYLSKGNEDYDILSVSSNQVGLLFASIAMLTGMVWAKFNWGMWWSNDPKQVSLAVLLLIYFAYFALRGSMKDSDKLRRISAVYSLISFVSAIFFLFVLPRISPSLHPGGGSDENMGPAVSFGEGMLDSSLALMFYLSVFGFLLIYFWLSSLIARTRKSEYILSQQQEVL